MNLFGESVLQKIRCFTLGTRSVCEKVNQMTKRGSMLAGMLKNTDKRKHWHFEILQNNAKSKNVFEKVSKPSRRQNVLNALFIRNITDVLSTGDIIPEIIGSGIEITGVKIAPCCKILNVYWQIPPSSFESEKKLAIALNEQAYKIRAELISRNLMGRVPQIFFVRDVTNAHIAAFEKAVQEVEEEMKGLPGIVPDDSFMSKKKHFYRFTDSKEEKEKETKEKVTEIMKDTSSKPATAPERPADMRSDVFGLNHDQLMNKVNALKTKVRLPEKTNVIIGPEWDENEIVKDDLFSKIPGTTVHSDSNREELLKKFHIERKKRLQEKRKMPKNDDGLLCEEIEVYEESEFSKFSTFDDEYVEEDTPERF